MRKLIVQEWMAFDGVIQAPGDPDEDRSGGFEHGGWHLRYFDEPSMKWVVSNLTAADGFVLGRRTYEDFARHWPNASDEEQPIAEPLNLGAAGLCALDRSNNMRQRCFLASCRYANE